MRFVCVPQKRDACRKRRSEHVRSLVLFVKSIDKRAMKMAMLAKQAAGKYAYKSTIMVPRGVAACGCY